ncbi:MAG: hypothetical protein H0U42_04780 [Thermoleophilaceae bacterium]|nr:hypothetical protein [Thermoleophilaceae bacterium]
MNVVLQAGIALAAFAGVTLIALALGAAYLGTALSFGLIAFAITVVLLMLRN